MPCDQGLDKSAAGDVSGHAARIHGAAALSRSDETATAVETRNC